MLTRILIVDDEAGIRMTLAANLELDGFEALEACDGVEALEVLASKKIDVVVSDMRMPRLNGLELLKKLKFLYPEIPVVLMTGFEVEAMIDAAVSGGVFTVLTKPFEVAELREVIRRAERGSVLLIERDGRRSESARGFLEGAGVRTTIAATRDDALDIIETGLADVCIVDVGPDNSDSHGILSDIRKADSSISLIAISPRLDPEILRMRSTGALAIIDRPFDAKRLLETIVRTRGKKAGATVG